MRSDARKGLGPGLLSLGVLNSLQGSALHTMPMRPLKVRRSRMCSARSVRRRVSGQIPEHVLLEEGGN